MKAKTLPWLIRTAVDDRLCERLRLAPFDLIRVRREFHVQIYGNLSHQGRKTLATGGTCLRFELLDLAILSAWKGPLRAYWLGFIEHTQRDVER